MRLLYNAFLPLVALLALPLTPARAQSREAFKQQAAEAAAKQTAAKPTAPPKAPAAAPTAGPPAKAAARPATSSAAVPSFTSAENWNDKDKIMEAVRYLSKKQAIICFQRGAELGNPEAMERLGFHYYWGFDVPQDYQQGVAWYRKAAAGGSPGGMKGLANAYSEGHGVKKDLCEAMRWYHQAADADDAGAMITLAVDYYKTGNCPTAARNLPEARRWLEKAIAKSSQDKESTTGAVYVAQATEELQALP